MNIKSVVIAAAIGAAITSILPAQESHAPSPRHDRWELLVPSGALMPVGEMRNAIRSANLSAIQVSYVPTPAIAITTTAGWARSRDIVTAGDPKLDVFTYDAGGELRARDWRTNFTPFVGAGIGGRSYNYRKLDVDATHNLSAYASAGGDLRFRRVRVRVEARDYVSAFKPLTGTGPSRTGNDIVVIAGLRLVTR